MSTKYAGLTIDAGTYTPTVGGTVNVQTSTPKVCAFGRLGDVVTVTGAVEVDPSTTGMVAFTLTLPIASNITNYQDVGGSGVADTNGVMLVVQVTGNAASNTAAFKFYANNNANQTVAFSFAYRVI